MILMTAVLCLGGMTNAPAAPTSNAAVTSAPVRESAVTVRETVAETIAHHRGLKVIQENLDVTRYELRRAKAGWGPSVDATGRYGASRLSDDTTRSYGSDKGMYAASGVGITLTQPLWDGFATRSRVRTGEATVESMEYRVFDNATSFGLDGLIAHVDYLRRREILRLAQENVARHKEILASQRERLNLGASTTADLTQTEGRLSRAMSTLTDAEASLREAEASYIRLTGKPVPPSLAEVYVPEGMFADPDAVMKAAEEGNPKLKAYLADIRAARGEKELAQSAYHPKINLEVGPNYSDRGGRGSNWTSSFDVMATMRWNLFNSGADKAETEAAESRIRQARQTAYNFFDDLNLEIADTWTRYMAAIEQRKYYQEAVVYNTQTRDAYLAQFNLGQRSLLDVLDAESELFNSATQEATARAWLMKDAARAHVELFDAPRPGAKEVLTRYRVLSENGESAECEIELLTGRTHQIRAHMAHLGHPLLGDDHYGDRAWNRSMRAAELALTAVRLELHFPEGSSLARLEGKTFSRAEP